MHNNVNKIKIALLTSRESWMVPYVENFNTRLTESGFDSKLFFDHKQIDSSYPIVFILSYFKIIGEKFLAQHEHNLVVHESELPKGRGWAPLFWQILEGKNTIPIVMFEASTSVDEGPIYLRDNIILEGHELHDEIRKKQAEKTFDLVLTFLKNMKTLLPVPQEGKSTHYRKRTPEDSELDITKPIAEQFNNLRIASNENYPAFFRFANHKYILNIWKEDE